MDSEIYGVIVADGQDAHLYGPLDKETAEAFAEFMRKEVDPTLVLPMHSPTRELLAWRQSHQCGEYTS